MARDKPPPEQPEELPPDVESSVRRLLDGDDEIVYSIASDIGQDGRYGQQWLVVTKRRLLLMTPDGDGRPRHDIPIKEIDAARIDNLVGNGMFEVVTNGRVHQVVRYSNTLATDFAKLARAIERQVKEEKPIDPEALRSREDEKRCDKCGRVLPVWTDVCIACMKKHRTILRILRYALPYKWHVLSAMLLTLVGSATAVVGPYLIKPFTNEVLFAGGTPTRPGTLTIDERLGILSWLVGVWILLEVVARAATVVRGLVVAWMGGRVLRDMRAQLFAQLQRLTLKYFDQKKSGALISRATHDVERVYMLIVDLSQELAHELSMLIGIAVVLSWLSWKLALLVLLPAPLVVLSTLWFSRVIHRIFHRLWRRWSWLTSRINDTLSGMRVVKAFAQEEREIGSFGRRNEELFQHGYRAEKIWAIFMPMMASLMFMAYIIARYAGGRWVVLPPEGDLDAGELMAFLGYIWMFYAPIQFLTRISHWAQRAITSAERVFEVMDSEPERYDAPDAVSLPELKGAVEFRDVTFGYVNHEPVLHNIDLKVEPGEMIGLVGHSGAGKSTMINLVCRFYQVDEGTVEIDGVDINKLKLKDLRSQIGVVPQESFLFSGTIAENIAYGDAEASPERIMAAAKAANAHDFIMAMPDGYDTEVGERGARVSAGERQRIAIARAILHDPKILILDEATASVDTNTEKQIQEALERLVKGRTTFAIAHRLSTLRNADRLFVLEKGKRVELGTHEELLEKKGVYAKLVEMQSEISKITAVGG
ncbi:MAG: ABC transporter transmembrane domain-containing protein [Armatimonadota bacterium]